MKVLDPIKNSQSFSINIIHTKLNNYLLLDNQPLLTTLLKLVKNSNKFYKPIEINILLNGEKAIDDGDQLDIIFNGLPELSTESVIESTLSNNFTKSLIRYRTHACFKTRDDMLRINIWKTDDIEYSSIILPLGTARDVIAHLASYKWYINVDEDDNLFSIGNLIKLQSTISLIKNPISLFGFKWNYIKLSKDEHMWIHSKMNPLIPEYWGEVVKDENGNDVEALIKDLPKYDDGRGLCSWNILHNQDVYDSLMLARPAVNKYDDCLFYSKLVKLIPEVTFIQLMIYDYHQEHGTMNKEKDAWSDSAMEYIDNESFSITQIIEFENEYGI